MSSNRVFQLALCEMEKSISNDSTAECFARPLKLLKKLENPIFPDNTSVLNTTDMAIPPKFTRQQQNDMIFENTSEQNRGITEHSNLLQTVQKEENILSEENSLSLDKLLVEDSATKSVHIEQIGDSGVAVKSIGNDCKLNEFFTDQVAKRAFKNSKIFVGSYEMDISGEAFQQFKKSIKGGELPVQMVNINGRPYYLLIIGFGHNKFVFLNRRGVYSHPRLIINGKIHDEVEKIKNELNKYQLGTAYFASMEDSIVNTSIHAESDRYCASASSTSGITSIPSKSISMVSSSVIIDNSTDNKSVEQEKFSQSNSIQNEFQLSKSNSGSKFYPVDDKEKKEGNGTIVITEKMQKNTSIDINKSSAEEPRNASVDICTIKPERSTVDVSYTQMTLQTKIEV